MFTSCTHYAWESRVGVDGEAHSALCSCAVLETRWLGAVHVAAAWWHLGNAAWRQALRAMVFLSTNALYMPVVNSLSAVYSCGSGGMWVGTGLACFSSVHIIVLVGVSVLLVAFVGAAAAGTCLVQPASV